MRITSTVSPRSSQAEDAEVSSYLGVFSEFYEMRGNMMQGVEDAAAMEDAGALAEGGNPEAGLPGGDGQLPLEQIAQLLAAMVQAGEIDEQTAAGVMEQLAGSAGAGAEGAAHEAGETPAQEAVEEAALAGGAPEGAVAAEAAPLPGGGEEVAVEEEPVTEPAKAAATLLASIK